MLNKKIILGMAALVLLAAAVWFGGCVNCPKTSNSDTSGKDCESCDYKNDESCSSCCVEIEKRSKKGLFGEILFRHRWWNHYERALAWAECGNWKCAINDLDDAINQRQKDQWDARTYGMRFIDYFPHREMGIAYYYLAKEGKEKDAPKAIKDMEEALKYLNLSLNYTPSARAVFYLEKHAYLLAKEMGIKFKESKPEICIEDFSTSEYPVTVSGYVKDENYITSVSVDGYPVFLLNSSEDLEISKSKNVFIKKQLSLSSGKQSVIVKATNIMGEFSQKSVEVDVKRTGPGIGFNKTLLNDKEIVIGGFVNDRVGVSELFINNRSIPIKYGEKAVSFNETVPINGNDIELLAYDILGNKIATTIPFSDVKQIKYPSNLFACNDLEIGNSYFAENGINKPDDKSKKAENGINEPDDKSKKDDKKDNPTEIKIYITYINNENGNVEREEWSELAKAKVVVDIYSKRLPFTIDVTDKDQIKKIEISDVEEENQIKQERFQREYDFQLPDVKELVSDNPKELFKINVFDANNNKTGKIFNLTKGETISVRILKNLDRDTITNRNKKIINTLKTTFQAGYQCDDDETGCKGILKKIFQKDKGIEDVLDNYFESDTVARYTIELDGNAVTFRQKRYEAFEEKNRYGVFIFPFFPQQEEDDILKKDSEIIMNQIKDKLNKLTDFTERKRFQIVDSIPSTANIPEKIKNILKIQDIPAINPDNEQEVKSALEYVANFCVPTNDYPCYKKVRIIIFGKINKWLLKKNNNTKRGTEVIIRIGDTEQKINFKDKEITHRIDSYEEQNLQSLSDLLANKFSAEFPLLVAKIIKTNGKSMNTDLSHPKIRLNYGVIPHNEKTGESIKKGWTSAKTKQDRWEAESVEEINSDYKVITE